VNDIEQATAIITNPTHFAVALRYAPGDSGAPRIIAMGRGKLAETIIEKGQQAGITVFRSPLLARAMFFTGDIGQEINDRLYGAVAAVLAYIYRLERGEIVAEPNVEVPLDMMFTENGRPAGQSEQ
jgi:flagellar biosynthetic protein FlhB